METSRWPNSGPRLRQATKSSISTVRTTVSFDLAKLELRKGLSRGRLVGVCVVTGNMSLVPPERANALKCILNYSLVEEAAGAT